MSNYSKQTNWAQFIPLVTVFFFWGFVAASNDILIPVKFFLLMAQIILTIVADYTKSNNINFHLKKFKLCFY